MDYETERPSMDPYEVALASWDDFSNEAEWFEDDYVREDFGWFGEAGLWD